MSFADSVANDYRMTDDTETVTYTPAARRVTVAPFTIDFADAHDFTAEEVSRSEGLWQQGDRRWSLGRNQFPAGFEPMAGDTITAGDGSVDVLYGPATLDDLSISWLVNTHPKQGS